jgi:hypothetical protein
MNDILHPTPSPIMFYDTRLQRYSSEPSGRLDLPARGKKVSPAEMGEAVHILSIIWARPSKR